MSKSIEGGWVITKDAARLTGYTQEFVSQLAAKGLIMGYDVGPDWLIGKESLLSYYQEHPKQISLDEGE